LLAEYYLENGTTEGVRCNEHPNTGKKRGQNYFLPNHYLGLVLSTKVPRSKKLSENFETYNFCQKGHTNYLADNLSWLAY
jgi:hypothetical protein